MSSYNRELYKAKYNARLERGLCVMCGKVPPEEGRTRCAECAEKGRKRWRTWYRSVRAGGKPGQKAAVYRVTLHGDEVFRGTRSEMAGWFNICPSSVQKWVRVGEAYRLFKIERVDAEVQDDP